MSDLCRRAHTWIYQRGFPPKPDTPCACGKVRYSDPTPPPASAEGALAQAHADLASERERRVAAQDAIRSHWEPRVRALEAALGEARELCDAAVTWWTVERETDMDAAVDCDAKYEALCSLMAAHAALENAAKKYAEARAFLADREG